MDATAWGVTAARSAAVMTVAGVLACGGVGGPTHTTQATHATHATHAASRVETTGPEPDLVVRSIALSRSAVTASGLVTVPVTVTVRAARAADAGGRPDEVYVELTRTRGATPDGAPRRRLIRLARTSGTPAEGTYVGTTPVSSTMHGTFAVTKAWPWLDRAGTGGDPEPIVVAGPSIVVTGRHIPRLTLSNAPMPVPISAAAYRFTGRLVDSETGTGYVRPVRLSVGLDIGCADSFPTQRVATDRAGFFSVRRGSGDLRWLHCAGVSATNDWSGLIVATGHWVQVRPWISATTARRSVTVGRSLQITGSVGGAPSPCTAALQRLDGSRWRHESSAVIRQSGRYTLPARPPRAGRITYRVATPRCGTSWPATSRAFAVRAVR